MKLAVILFNLGGPTSQESVKPFLFNLFKDPHIIRLPAILRYPLAWFISALRTQKAKKIYAALGGGSPLNLNTEKQVKSLEKQLQISYPHAKVFMCMRYAPPMTKEVVKKVRAFSPDKIVLLPLYPQFSTTTTKSSFKEWDDYASDLKDRTLRHCCYPTEKKFIAAHRTLIKEHIQAIKTPIKLLFSAHGVPLDIIEDGDPYAFQVEETVKAVMACKDFKNITYQICYQSRVGPKKWLEPNIDEALEHCSKEKIGAVIIPISFVSDHSETLVELDIQYKEKAENIGLSHYSRVTALSDIPLFIESLASQVTEMIDEKIQNQLCPSSFKECGYKHCMNKIHN